MFDLQTALVPPLADEAANS